MPSKEDRRQGLNIHAVLIISVALILSITLIVRAFLNFRTENYLGHVEAAQLTCAFDFVHGVFYRPLVGQLGYGGTRIFPLFFVLTGSISKVLGSLETSGLILCGGSVVALVFGCYFLLRRLDVNPLLCVAAVTVILASATTQEALLRPKSDGLAAMLNIWGLALCLGANVQRRHRYLAALFFSLAFSAKMTTLFGFASVILTWFLAKRYKEVFELGFLTVLGYISVLLSIYWRSEGRVLEIFRACSLGGGSRLLFLKGPITMVRIAEQYDPLTFLFLVLGLGLFMTCLKHRPLEVIPTYFFLVLIVTAVIFGSPGIAHNHFIDLQVAAVLLFTLSTARDPSIKALGTSILTLSLLLGWVSTEGTLREDLRRTSFRADIQTLLGNIQDHSRPVLAENSLIVLKSGKTPYLLDPFMFRVFTLKHPELGMDLWRKMNSKEFSAIVLIRDPASIEGQMWYRDIHFGGSFLEELNSNYHFEAKLHDQYLYKPNQGEVLDRRM